MPRAGEHEGRTPNRPFLCPRCGLWYTALPFEPWDVCDRGKHSDSADCHYNHSPSTESERVLGEAMAACLQAMDAITGITNLSRLQAAMDVMNAALAKVPEALRLAGVTQLPGREDSEDRGLMDLRGIRVLAAMNRRPQEEVERAERSERICKAMALEIPEIVKEVNRRYEAARSVGQAPDGPPPSVTETVQTQNRDARPDKWAAARAAKVAKAAARRERALTAA